ncbi:MAG: RHS repeat-associated core domain-containing protein [Kiritimatiellae bacterium]|nr:RHS repeat-associated core domain-containing protein [Kiritimatiellia bacterium]
MSRIVRRFHRAVLFCTAAAAFAALALDYALVDVTVEPPEVISVSGCISGCETTSDGVLLYVDGVEDVWLIFNGLPEDVELGYALVGADGSVLATGEGCCLPIEDYPSTAAVSVFSLSGETDWGEVSEVYAETSAEAARARASALRLATPGARTVRQTRSSAPDRVVAEGSGFLLLDGSPATLTLDPGTLYSTDSVAGLSPGNTSRNIDSIDEMLVSGNFPGHGSFSLSASGYVYVSSGESFTVGADDYATLSVGGASSTVNGNTGFIWGSQASVSQGGLKYATVTYGSYGGPYQFGLSGLSDRTFYGSGTTVPYASLTADPASLKIPWSGSYSTSTLTISPYDSRVTYQLTRSGGHGSLSGSGASRTFTPDVSAFLKSGQHSSTANISMSQSCYGVSGPSRTASVTLVRDEPDARFSPESVTVAPGQPGIVTIKGLYEPYLEYRLPGGSTTMTFSADGMTGRGVTTNMESVAWSAIYDGVQVASGTASVEVIYDLSKKEAKNDECLCKKDAGGSKSDVENACVSFTQRFGTTPRASSAPWGVLAIEEEDPTPRLATPAVLRYDHPMMRRIRGHVEGTAVVMPPMGHPITYENGAPSQNSVTHDSRLVDVAGAPVPTVREVFPDRSEVVYTNGVPSAIVTSDGVRVEVADLGIEVIKDSGGSIRQIWSETDGLLDVTVPSVGRFRVNWYAPAAVGPKNASGDYAHSGSPLKYFDFGTPFGGTAGQSFSLVEHRSSDMEFPTRWDWDATVQDWTMVRGTGNEAVTYSRGLMDNGDGTWTVTTSTSSAQGTARQESKTYSGRNGNALVSASSGGRTTYSASRVDSGDGAGRPCTSTDGLGLSTTNAYDSAGRTVFTATSGGAVERATFYEYPAEGATPDFAPSRTIHVAGGVTNRIDTYTRIGTRESGLTEISTVSDGTSVRTNMTVRHPAASSNVFEAGRVALAVAPDGAATTNEYEAAEGFLYVRTATRGVFANGAFATVDGKSTRTRDFLDAQGNVAVTVSEALVGGQWRETASATNSYNVMHTLLGTVRSNGRFSDSSRICTGPLWTLGEDGIATTNQYDSTKRMVSSTRYGPFGAVATAYTLDAEGRTVAETRTAAGMLPLATSRTYDTEGRLASETDEQGLTTTYAYSADGRTTTVTLPSGGTRVTTLNADGSLASVTGSAVAPEYYSYGVTADGLEWTKVGYLSPNGARWTKTFRNAFGETVREERPGANGSTLVTERTYNEKGQLVSTVSTGQPTETRAYDAWGDLVSVVRSADGTSRTQSVNSANALVGGEVWRVESSALSCSDATIAPLATTNMTQVSGFSLANEARQVSIDVRGNATETWSEFDPATSTRLTYTSIPTATNIALSESVDGVTTLSVSHSAVTNSAAYDAFRRAVIETDGRGNATTNAYDALGRLASVTDPTGATAAYAYDAAGRLAAVTNALGVATVYEYDLRGNKVYEGGGTYPVSYAYDAFNVMTNMTTYRNAGGSGSVPASGDTTTWSYDEATGLLLAKTYADGHGPTYTYTDSGNLATRTWARGVITTYAYDGWNQLVSTTYSDGTPSISLAYDAMGRQISATDAVGTTTTTYSDYGEVASESVSGLYSRTLSHVRDDFGRNLGYNLNNSRKNIIEYETDTARTKRVMFASAWYTYGYLPGTDLKSSLTVGTAGRTDWTYEPSRDLLTQVKNTAFGSVVSQYDYVNDALGRRTEIARSGTRMTESRTDAYGYNDRNELTNAVKNAALSEYAYQYDDIGNRLSSLDLGEAREYTANNLNQYVNIAEGVGDFIPQFDLDGNQTLVKTSTGIWSVSYNGENRPVLWTCGSTNITMKFDRMGRRVEYIETINSVTNAHHRFVYDGYLCIQRLDGAANNAVDLAFGWDPTEPIATRPLWMQRVSGTYNIFYFHDGNKNVSDLVSYQSARGVPAHYEYAPFGAVTAATTNTAFTAFNVAETNPYRFSSEYADDTLGLVYYNYRHYEPLMGRWVSRDPLDADNQYVWCYNRPCNLSGVDVLGLTNESGAFGWDNYSVEQRKCCNGKPYFPSISCCRKGEVYQRHQVYTGVSYFCMHARWWYQTIITIRPFSTRQFALTHCWLNVDGNRFGAYPNGGPLKNPQSDGQSIQDDDHHAEDEDAWYTSRTDVNLSPCQYDIEVFKNCMAGKRNATWMWTAWNNCGDFVEAAVTDCTKKAQYDK